MFKTPVFLLICAILTTVKSSAQVSTLSVSQQTEDFAIFKGGLREGHSGLYYFIEKAVFDKNCDSIRNTFREGTPVEDFYLKLRYLVTLLKHGHTRVSLPVNRYSNYKMAVLDSTKLYLPFEFIIINNQLIIKEDCSREQLFPRYSVVKTINNISSKALISTMLHYMPADGVNQTFKYYSLYTYFYFHQLFNLFYPDKKGVKIELETGRTHYYIQLLQPKEIDSIYFAKNNRNISQYDKQLVYKAGLPNQSAWLKAGSFYKGLIEQFGQNYESFLDSSFAAMKAGNIKNLMLDLRNNEGGGDGYDFLLLSYLVNEPMVPEDVTVPGRKFSFTKYAVNLSEEVKAFISNPGEFLQNDSSLLLKKEYTGQVNYPVSKNFFNGNIIVLTNGGTFSAATNVVKRLYNYRRRSTNKILFVGEENGGDIYANTECAGQGYTIRLPNSGIETDMPVLCTGKLIKDYPQKRLPDYTVFDKPAEQKSNKDTVLDFAIKLCSKK